ncbi:hypothetical protein HWV62_45318 [Athelia sp. TMB]|nr:hypothetical protein HWV62_45318 [Athelia sp. TMB]
MMGSTFNVSGVTGSVTNVAGSAYNVKGNLTVVKDGDGTRVIRDGVVEIQGRLKGIQDDKKKEEIDKWMAAPDTSLNYTAARNKYQQGTGSWLIDDPDFKRWKDDPNFVLWLHGGLYGMLLTIPLSWMRKDHIVVGFNHPISEHRFIGYPSSSAIDNMKKSCKGNPSIGYAYFFFDGTSVQSKLATHESLVRSCIIQLSDRFDGIPPALVELYKDEEDGRSQPVLSSLEETLLRILQSFSSAYIVIDALDECDERPKVLKWIQSVASQMSGILHLMVTSRPEPDIKNRLRSLSNLLKIDAVDHRASADIRHYIDVWLSEVDEWTESQKELVRIALVNGAGGVFRWVALMIHQLLSNQCLSTSELEMRLNSLPKGLDEAYTKIIEQSPRRADVVRLLQWIIFGEQSFTAEQLAEVAAINFDAGDNTLPFYDRDRRYGSPDNVLRACSGLVIEVQVKEFLLSKVIQLRPTRSIRCNESISHQAIAKTCLAYLLQFNELDCVTNKNIESFPLASYAAKHCVPQVESICGEDLDATLEQMIQQLASPVVSCALINWYRLVGDHRYLREPTLKNRIELWDVTPALHAAIIFPLTRLGDHLIKNGKCGVALDVTSDLGSPATVRLLLEKGADINATGGRHGTALQAASYEGYLDIVQLLLEKGADINVTGGWYGTALQAASLQGRLDIVQLLLEKGADINVTGGRYGTALQAASYKGYLDIVQLLLEKGADINATGGRYGTALQAASLQGRLEIARLLLENGADVNLRVGKYDTALQAAAYCGEFMIVKLLLEKGAEVNARGGKGGSQ